MPTPCRCSRNSMPPIPSTRRSPACLLTFSPRPVSSRLPNKLYVALLAKSPDDVELLVAHGQNLIRQQHFAEAYGFLRQSHQTRLRRRRCLEWNCLRGIQTSSARARRPRPHHAFKISSGCACNLLSVGHILRLIERPERRRSPTTTTSWIRPAANSQIRNGRRANGSWCSKENRGPAIKRQCCDICLITSN